MFCLWINTLLTKIESYEWEWLSASGYWLLLRENWLESVIPEYDCTYNGLFLKLCGDTWVYMFSLPFYISIILHNNKKTGHENFICFI